MLSGCLPGYLFGPQLQLMADTGTVPSVTSPDEYGHAKPTGLPQQPPTLGKHRPGGRGRCSSMACNTCLQGILSWVLAGKLETWPQAGHSRWLFMAQVPTLESTKGHHSKGPLLGLQWVPPLGLKRSSKELTTSGRKGHFCQEPSGSPQSSLPKEEVLDVKGIHQNNQKDHRSISGSVLVKWNPLLFVNLYSLEKVRVRSTLWCTGGWGLGLEDTAQMLLAAGPP